MRFLINYTQDGEMKRMRNRFGYPRICSYIHVLIINNNKSYEV